jgi:BirA family biotin operon repressor/biotin-[acetyl-CoA-carboxylase] ligase
VNAALLQRLRDAGGAYVPLDALGLPPPDAGRDLDELEAFGFAIERHPLLGAAYRGPAERLCPDQIEHGLGTAHVGRRVAVWNRVTSTNDLAARAAQSSANAGLVVLAEEQTAGRGRRGRAWSAPPRRSVLMSALLFPPAPLADPAWLTSLGALAVAEVVSDRTGRDARIKWPNDVRVGGRKVAGVLVERGAGAVIGIGVNANLDADDLLPDLRGAATSLLILRGEPVDRSELAKDLIRRLDALYAASLASGPGALNGPWRSRSEHLGRRVVVQTLTGAVAGRLVDIDLLDGLSVSVPGGAVCRVANREVLAVASDEADLTAAPG